MEPGCVQRFDSAKIAAYKVRSHLVPMIPVTTTSPSEAKENVLATAGASIPARDTIDRRLVKDVVQGTGHSIATTAEQPEGAWPTLRSLSAPPDDDHDGMPNEWELARGLSPNDPTDRIGIGLDGYTNLETYLNTLTGERVTGVNGTFRSRPGGFSLNQNFPNPFNPTTAISFQLSAVSEMKLTVYDVLGREVAVLVNERMPAGIHEVKFDAAGLSSGVYLYRLEAGNFVQARKLILLR